MNINHNSPFTELHLFHLDELMIMYLNLIINQNTYSIIKNHSLNKDVNTQKYYLFISFTFHTILNIQKSSSVNLNLLEIKKGNRKTLSQINFKRSSTELTEQSIPYLENLLHIFKENDVKVIIEGHTDNSGDYKLNVKLSKDRAYTIKGNLIKNGIERNRIKNAPIIRKRKQRILNKKIKERDRVEKRLIQRLSEIKKAKTRLITNRDQLAQKIKMPKIDKKTLKILPRTNIRIYKFENRNTYFCSFYIGLGHTNKKSGKFEKTLQTKAQLTLNHL